MNLDTVYIYMEMMTIYRFDTVVNILYMYGWRYRSSSYLGNGIGIMMLMGLGSIPVRIMRMWMWYLSRYSMDSYISSK